MTPARRRTSRRTTVLLVALLALALAASACGGGGGGDAVTIYSGRGQSLVGPLLEQFAEETGISVDVRYGESAELALLIEQEGDRSPADVFYSQSPGATGYLAERELLAPLPDGALDRVDPRFRSDDGRWVGVSGRQRVLVYNSELVEESELPGSVFEILEPPLAGRVAVPPSNGSFQDFVSAMVAVEGEDTAREFLEGLVATGAPTYANNNAIVEAVSRGEVPMGLVNHYYNHRFLAEDPSLPSRNHLFDGDDIGALLIESPVSILATSSQREKAERLVEFLLAAEAQTYFAQETFEYPLAAGVEPAADIPPLATLEVPPFDLDELGGDLQTTLELIRESGLSG